MTEQKGYPHRSKHKFSYHMREGYPVIHLSKTGREYIMVRKKGGGTKRLYIKKGKYNY